MNLVHGLKFFTRLLHYKATGKRVPLTVILNLTHRCNCRCQHCYAEYFERNAKDSMTTEQIRKILEDLSENGCLRVSYSGGEPLLRKDIGELILYAKQLGLSVTVNSNGILVPEHLSTLEPVDALAISLDGRPEHHDMLRGKGTGEKALEGIRAACAAGIRLHVNMVLNRYNLDDVDYLLELAIEHGFYVEFAIAISKLSSENTDGTEFKPDDGPLRKTLRHIITKKKQGAPILFSANAYESVLETWKDFSMETVVGKKPPAGMPKCPAGRFFCIIEANGDMCACPHLLDKIETRNVLDVGVGKAWQVAGNHSCVGCYQVYHHEFSRLMDLSPQVVWNYLKSSLKEGRV